MFNVTVEAAIDFEAEEIEAEEIDPFYITAALNIIGAGIIIGIVVVFYGRYKKQLAAVHPPAQPILDWCRHCGLRPLPQGTEYCPNCGKDTRLESIGLQ